MRRRLTNLFAVLLISLPSLPRAENLMDIYGLALQNDPITKEAEAKQSAAGESRDQGLARFFPTLAATGGSSRNWFNTRKLNFQGTDQEYWNNNFSLNLSQPLFHWDHWIQLSQSDNQIAQAEAAYQSELQNLIVRTTEAYFNVLSAQDNLQFTVSEKQAISKQLEQAKERFEVGIIPITDVYEAQAAFDATTANELEAANNLDNKKEALREIIGENEGLISPLGETLPLKKPEPDNMSKWGETAEFNNLSIVASFNQMEVSRKAIDIQRNGHLPTLDLVGSYGVSDNSASFGPRGDTQSIGVQLNVPLFEGGAVNSRTRQASFEYEAAKENLTAIKRSVKRQVNNTYRSILTNISRIEALKATVTSAESALEAAEAGFEVGIRTMVDVLAEQRYVYRAKRDLSRTRYDYLVNTIKLKQTTSDLNQNDLEQINGLLVTNPAK
ncbi:TolC family outer membrane protein [Methyloglobulus sp.]|uniref:TolC family outer membrane protein n=1 Tax=Methyloglobulus sp. TaxID=2518622 RepID=UPI003988D217